MKNTVNNQEDSGVGSFGDFPVEVRPLEPRVAIIPCGGFQRKSDGGSISFSTRAITGAATPGNPIIE